MASSHIWLNSEAFLKDSDASNFDQVTLLQNYLIRKISLTYRWTAGDSSTAIEELILMDYYGGVPATENKQQVKQRKYLT